MKQKSIDSQINKIFKIFGNRITTTTSDGKTMLAKNKSGNVDLLVVSVNEIFTRDLFSAINLGCRENNSWFLDLKNAYDLVKVPETSYVLKNVNITSTVVPKNFAAPNNGAGRSTGLMEKTFPCFGNRPLTFHDVLNLAFQYPGIFNENIQGIQAYGSRFTKEEATLKPSSDDTLEIYRKGNVGKGFLKLAREHYRYHEDTKIIPFIEL